MDGCVARTECFGGVDVCFILMYHVGCGGGGLAGGRYERACLLIPFSFFWLFTPYGKEWKTEAWCVVDIQSTQYSTYGV